MPLLWDTQASLRARGRALLIYLARDNLHALADLNLLTLLRHPPPGTRNQEGWTPYRLHKALIDRARQLGAPASALDATLQIVTSWSEPQRVAFALHHTPPPHQNPSWAAELFAHLEQATPPLPFLTSPFPLRFPEGLPARRKQQEIAVLQPWIERWIRLGQSTVLVDVGAGAGHLVQTLHHACPSLELHTFDRRPLAFVPQKMTPCRVFPSIVRHHRLTLPHPRLNLQLAKPYVLSLGLHTCGDLSPLHLEAFARSGSHGKALNIPCCPHLLSFAHVGQAQGWNQEKGVQGLRQNREGLHLANLRHTPWLIKEEANKVWADKKKRYTLALLTAEREVWRRRLEPLCGIRRNNDRGENSFADYLQAQIDLQNKGGPSLTLDERKEVEAFADQEMTQENLAVALGFRFLQSRLLGHALEQLLLEDRALHFLERFGREYHIARCTVFPSSLSVRGQGFWVAHKASASPLRIEP